MAAGPQVAVAAAAVLGAAAACVSAAICLSCGASSSPPGGVAGGDPASSGAGGMPPALGPSENGIATYYAADGSGNCSFDPSPGDLNVAAIDAAEYAGSAACGECVTVRGPSGAVTVRIVDQCPGCEKGHLDLSAQAFAAIADPAAGRVPIVWTVVACNVSGPVRYHIKDGSSQYWTAIQVLNARLPIAKLQWWKAGAWTDVPRQPYNYFVVSAGVGPGPYQVRVTASDGQSLVDTLPPVLAGATIAGAAQL